jgi:hypothetical protein
MTASEPPADSSSEADEQPLARARATRTKSDERRGENMMDLLAAMGVATQLQGKYL